MSRHNYEVDASEFGQAMRACRSGIGAVSAFSFFINLLMLAIPLYMFQVYDRVLTSRSVETLVYLTLVTCLALLVLAGLEMVRSSVMIRVSSWLQLRLGRPILEEVVKNNVAQRDQPTIQPLRDLATFRSFIASPGMNALLDAPWSPVYIAAIFVMHSSLGILALAGAALLLGLAVWNELATRRLLETAGRTSIQALNAADAAVRNADAIQAMGMLPNLARRWHRSSRQMIEDQGYASVKGAQLAAASRFFRLGLQVAVLGYGAWLVLKSEISPGIMIAASILIARALGPVEVAIGSWRTAVAARGAYRRLKQLLHERVAGRNPMPLPAPRGRLSVEGMTFQYPGAREPILKNINFNLPPGEAMGLIGPTASGKSTLARLIVGNLAPRSGCVRLDGAELYQWNPDDRGRHIGYLPQDIELFAGLVRDNIARMGEGDPEAVAEAARISDIHEMVLALPRGYETDIGHGGAVLSGGQRQRIALARALYGNPRLIVLDEPNANLDQPGEQALLAALDQLKSRGATVIVIAHRPNVLRKVDKILVLRNGTVQMFGARDAVFAEVGATQTIAAHADNSGGRPHVPA